MTDPGRNGLLAHLIGGFAANRHEDLASDALAYLLNGSDVAMAAVAAIAAAIGVSADPVRVSTQRADADTAARPDLAFTDRDGTPVVLGEVKFDAGLTDNQPATYLRMTGGLVLFIVPARRIESLWPEVCDRAAAVGAVTSTAATGEVRAATVTGAATLAMVSWTALIGRLRTAVSLNDPAWAGDLEQLAVLTGRFEADGFIPFGGDELTADTGRRIMQLGTIVDALTDRTSADSGGWINTTRLRGTPTRGAYIRYINFGVLAGGVSWDAGRWGAPHATPLHLRINRQGNSPDPDGSTARRSSSSSAPSTAPAGKPPSPNPTRSSPCGSLPDWNGTRSLTTCPARSGGSPT